MYFLLHVQANITFICWEAAALDACLNRLVALARAELARTRLAVVRLDRAQEVRAAEAPLCRRHTIVQLGTAARKTSALVLHIQLEILQYNEIKRYTSKIPSKKLNIYWNFQFYFVLNFHFKKNQFLNLAYLRIHLSVFILLFFLTLL